MSESQTPPTPQPGTTAAWARTVGWISVTALLVLGALAALHMVTQRAERMVNKAAEVPAKVASVLSAIKSGQIQTAYRTYATQITGTNRLQVATLSQMEVFERKDTLEILQMPLPEVIVTASAPVEYTYYLDLEEEWLFQLDSQQKLLKVSVPPIRFNKPAVDASSIKYDVRKGSVLRNETAVLQDLKATVTGMCDHRARHNVRLVREVVRTKTVDFVEKWLKKTYTDSAEYEVKVNFRPREPEPAKTGQPPGRNR